MQVMQEHFKSFVELQSIVFQFHQLATYFLHIFDRSCPNLVRIIDTRGGGGGNHISICIWFSFMSSSHEILHAKAVGCISFETLDSVTVCKLTD